MSWSLMNIDHMGFNSGYLSDVRALNLSVMSLACNPASSEAIILAWTKWSGERTDCRFILFALKNQTREAVDAIVSAKIPIVGLVRVRCRRSIHQTGTQVILQSSSQAERIVCSAQIVISSPVCHHFDFNYYHLQLEVPCFYSNLDDRTTTI